MKKQIRLFKQLKTFIALAVLACTPGVASPAPPAAHTADLTGAPPALQPWHDWVRYQQEFRQCPLIAGAQGTSADDFLCAWPGVLTLQASDQGATFAQHWQVSAPSWVPLPGDNHNWPQEVSVNGAPQPVLRHDDAPSLWLAAGDYAVRGRIAWQERPQALTIAPISALIALSVNGKPIQPLQRDGNQLTLGRSTAAVAEAADSVEPQVYRKLTDGIPAQLTTRIQLQVSGKARQIEIASMLPEHFAAIALESPWPARLDAAGRLQVQAQPGQATLVLSARADAPLKALQARLPQEIKQEVWSYEAAPALRVTAVTASGGALAVDPKQAGVPPEWQTLPAFAMSAASQLNIEERSRGLAVGEANRLTLARELWLDFSGDGYFAKDTIGGQMQQGWRLDVAAPYRLQRARAGDEALLVTQGVGDGGGKDAALTGIEWRSPQVALDASVRIAAGPASALLVTGWRQPFDQVNATLHLPYGYKLLAAPGADAANDSWVARWTILDIFLAAFIALLAWRLLGITGGVVTAAYLVLALQEPGAPLWTLAVVLALALLGKALPDGRLGKTLQIATWAALAVFCLTAIAFAPGQLRSALYPQLERIDNGYAAVPAQARYSAVPAARYEAVEDRSVPAEVAAAPPPPPTPAPSAKPALPELSKPMSPIAPSKLAAPSSSKHDKARQRYAQSNVVQTGAGEPDWRIGQHYSLRWSGPVLAEQTVRLVISPPWLTRLLRVAMIVLLGLIVWRVARRALPGGGLKAAVAAFKPRTVPATAAALAISVLTGALWLHPTPASAQDTAAFPPEKLLQTLQERVNQAPRCAPDCASIARADIAMQGSTLTVRLQAHAGDRVALPLPGIEDNTTLLRVRVDGQPIDGVRRNDQTDVVPLPRGVHLVELEYAVSGGDTSLRFSLPPMRAVFDGRDWQADGIDEERLINDTVHLARKAAQTPGAAGSAQPLQEGGAQQFPSYVRVTRTLRLDLDWNVDSSVTRISPREGGITLAVPLLAGEHVTTPGIKVQADAATVSLGQNEPETTWQSRLDKNETLKLTAPALAERAEVWRVQVSPSWHVRWAGVPVTLPGDGDETVFEFHPLPGETLTLTATQPQAVDGMVRAIDHVSVEHAIGMRASQHTLTFRLRASQGGEHIITLPAGMEVMGVMRDRENLNLRPIDGKLTLPVSPGEQTFAITMRESRAAATVLHTPVFDLGLPAANIDIKATLPDQRWLLASWGPPVGPAVLYWGELLVALALAFLLTRVLTRHGWTALSLHHWFLLVLGFSTFSWTALLLIVCWLIALDWRRRAGALQTWQDSAFNAVQVGLVALTAAALYALIIVVPMGLLGMPDMGVVGHGSAGNQLNWFADRSQSLLPSVTLISLPMWAYRVAMLAWALWLAWMVIGWLRHGLSAWMQGGYWRKVSIPMPKIPKAAKAAASPENHESPDLDLDLNHLPEPPPDVQRP